MENERNHQCRKCGGIGTPSKALVNYHFIDKSYIRGEKEFVDKLVDCIKCQSCGHSWIPKTSTNREIEKIWRKEIQLENIVFNTTTFEEKPNQKQFKKFDESLFKAYINKFSNEDKLKAKQILLNKSKKEFLKILIEKLESAGVRKYTCVNEFGYSQLERDIVDLFFE